MMIRWREWLRWSWFGEAVKFVSSELRFSRSGAQGLLLNYRDLWPQEYSERPFTLAVWLCSFVERHKVSGSWMQSAITSLNNRQYQAVQRCSYSRMAGLLGQAAERELPAKQAFQLALSMLDSSKDREAVAKPAA
ncbi:MAG: hypothetical protein V3T83_04045 [Acidobacteriota bacterium]